MPWPQPNLAAFARPLARRTAPVVAVVLLGACGTSAGLAIGRSEPMGPASTAPAPGTPVIDWEVCGDNLDCGRLAVPFDSDDPDGPTTTLSLVRHRATQPSERIGSLLVNPGGPGVDALWLAEDAPAYFGPRLVERFDIIAWDPRGVGTSDPPVDCIDDYDDYFALDPTPDTPEEEAAQADATTAFAAGCERRVGDEVLAAVSTRESATDMDRIRRALGEDEISYFGFSYGSELGGTWATMFPDTVRAAVFDSSIDPTVPDVENDLLQAAGFEAAVNSFLADCAEDDDCAFRSDGDPGAALDRLLVALDESPLVVSPDRAPVNQAVAYMAIADALYSDERWPQLAQALADAEDGDGAGLLAGYDSYFQRNEDGTWPNVIEALTAVLCADRDPSAPEPDEAELTARFQQAAPRLWPIFTGDSCSEWPVPGSGRVVITGAGAGPILVVGTTGDPATPLESSRAMAGALEQGRLVVVEADQHIGYGLNDCVVNAVDTYLTELVLPPESLVCR